MIDIDNDFFLTDLYDINLLMVELIEERYEKDEDQLESYEWKTWMRVVNHLGVVF